MSSVNATLSLSTYVIIQVVVFWVVTPYSVSVFHSMV